MANTGVQAAFYRALKTDWEVTDSSKLRFQLTNGNTADARVESATTNPFVGITTIDWTDNTTITWSTVDATSPDGYSAVKVQTTDGTDTYTFCTLPLTKTSLTPNGTDVELTSAVLTVGTTNTGTGVVNLLDTTDTTGDSMNLDLTMIKDQDATTGGPTYLTGAGEVATNESYSVDWTPNTTQKFIPVQTGTKVDFTSPTTGHTNVDGVRARIQGNTTTVASGQLTTNVDWTSNATLQLTEYTVTFS